MKFDKETVLKNQFWLLLAVAMPLAIASIFILLTVVSAQITKNKKDLDTLLKNAKADGDAKNQIWIDQMQKKTEEAEALKKVVWSKAYNQQKDLFTWPTGLENEFDLDTRFRDGLFAIEVKAERGQAGGAPPAQAPAEAEKEDKEEARKVVKQFQGVVVPLVEDVDKEVAGNALKVKGRSATKIFLRTSKMKVKLDGKEFISWLNKLQPGDKVDISYIQGKYFGDLLTDEEQKDYLRQYTNDKNPANQIYEILRQVDPVNDKGEGRVILRDWLFKEDQFPVDKKFLRFVSEWKKTDIDISDEAWMAQEDLWIQREIYRLVRLANDYVSKLKRIDNSKEGSTAGKFANPYWQLDLKIAGPKKLSVKIKNLLPIRQKLDIRFNMKLQKNATEPDNIRIPGTPLDPGQSVDAPIDLEALAATGIYDVEQVISWESAAVKRIDQISIGNLAAGDCAHSHRTFPLGLKPFREKKADANAPPPAAQPPMGVAGKGPMGGKVATENTTPNGLFSDRYVEVTQQARRVPVGITLIVDQDHIDRVLTAFANSNLRFLTTQVIINRYPHSLRPSIQGTDSATPGTTGRPPPFVGGPMVPMGPTSASTGAAEDHESNVELVIYGIVSLYERYPPRPPDAPATP